ncbi:hypothetical protein PV325_008092 [Microctonus aethiopoides]|uniref:Aminopeptidase P N-terminal domain-containing protein n=1 Tax=Microctonus aethiopoides TaxID=144406 RepID=A0AA39FND4_9HYME|nr:hypothetical protein PV325_008092 [Microctonus aethiopoides]KAK0172429.1 hypothetical protein PV328_005746 [Microctonus aethiopoides]
MNHGRQMFGFVKKCLIPRLENIGAQIVMCHSTATSQNPLSHKSYNKQVHTTYGQPTATTHPHLLKPGELVPGIKLDEFIFRRTKLVEHILNDGYVGKASENQHIVIIPSSTKLYMSEKIPYVFRQNTDFLYFTGCQEPDSVLVITANNDRFESTLFVRKKDPRSELWDGPTTGVEVAAEMFGVDKSYPITEFELFINSLLHENGTNVIWYDNNDIIHPDIHKKILQVVKSIGNRTFLSPKTIFHDIRLIKSEAEIELMKKSCKIASAAIAKTIQVSKCDISEHELFATVDYECRINGAEFLAYPPVVAGGKNANVIHYITNNQIVHNGEMVLMDAGCEYRGYSSDITRTWPINGTFTSQQRILYEVVLDVQKILIQQLKEFPTLDQIFYEMCRLLGIRLQEVGLIPKNFSSDELLKAAFSYCPHHVSHYLGMDVHDSGKISRNIKTQPGMIITVEPGIYVSPTNPLAPTEFHNLGIRIEDDILIKEKTPVILTESCPKEIDDIEALAKYNQ